MTLDRSISPSVRGFKNLSIPLPRYVTLDNGVRLVIVDNGSQEVNRLTILWNGGICETTHPTIANLAVNLLREGTASHSGADIAEILEYNGAWLKGQVHSHHTSLVAHSLNSKVNQVFPLLAELITLPTYPTHEFEVFREKIARSAILDREKVEFYSAMEIRRLLMGQTHRLALTDSPEEIMSVTTDDLKCFNCNVFSAPFTIYVAGRITSNIEVEINKNFGRIAFLSSGKDIELTKFKPSNQRKVVVNRPGAMQSALRMAIPTICRDSDDYETLRLTVMALGGYFGSRLMCNIREDKGFTYGISASLLGYREGGIISIGTQCDNKYVEPLIDEVVKEIERMKTGDFSDDEIFRLKNYAMSQLVATLDSPFSIMDYYENITLSGTPQDYFYRQISAINQLNADQLGAFATKYFSINNLYTAISGDKAIIS